MGPCLGHGDRYEDAPGARIHCYRSAGLPAAKRSCGQAQQQLWTGAQQADAMGTSTRHPPSVHVLCKRHLWQWLGAPRAHPRPGCTPARQGRSARAEACLRARPCNVLHMACSDSHCKRACASWMTCGLLSHGVQRVRAKDTQTAYMQPVRGQCPCMLEARIQARSSDQGACASTACACSIHAQQHSYVSMQLLKL